jgi:hypothetical protein
MAGPDEVGKRLGAGDFDGSADTVGLPEGGELIVGAWDG